MQVEKSSKFYFVSDTTITCVQNVVVTVEQKSTDRHN